MEKNYVSVRGNLTKNPESKHTQSGAQVVNFGLAINTSYKAKNGEWQEEVCFIDCALWGRQGDFLMQNASKGDPVLVDGSLAFRSWEGNDGQRRTKHFIKVRTVHYLTRPQKGGGASNGASQPQAQAQSHNVNNTEDESWDPF